MHFIKITLTEAAKEHLTKIWMESTDGLSIGPGIRISIVPAGCSGYTYNVDLAKDLKESDISIHGNAVPLIVDEKQSKLLDNTVIDYVQDGLSKSLIFNNPNITEKCGCGNSFQLK